MDSETGMNWLPASPFEDAKVGAGETAVQGDMLLPANANVTGLAPEGDKS